MGASPALSKVLIIMEESEIQRSAVADQLCDLFVAELTIDLLFEDRLFLFILPFQLICWPLKSHFENWVF